MHLDFHEEKLPCHLYSRVTEKVNKQIEDLVYQTSHNKSEVIRALIEKALREE